MDETERIEREELRLLTTAISGNRTIRALVEEPRQVPTAESRALAGLSFFKFISLIDVVMVFVATTPTLCRVFRVEETGFYRQRQLIEKYGAH